jgi:hypothetical protein
MVVSNTCVIQRFIQTDLFLESHSFNRSGTPLAHELHIQINAFPEGYLK